MGAKLIILVALACFSCVDCNHKITRTYFNRVTRERIIHGKTEQKTGTDRHHGEQRSSHQISRTINNPIPAFLIVPVIGDINDFRSPQYIRQKRKVVKIRKADEDEDIVEDFDPFSDVDETADVADTRFNEYDDIERTEEVESTITEAEADSTLQQAQIDELATRESQMEVQIKQSETNLRESEKEKELEKERGDLERKKAKQLGEPTADCTMSPCANGGVCLVKQPEGHECLCPSNYRGLNCQIWDGGHGGYRFRLGATIAIREMGSEVEVTMPTALMFVLTVIQISSFLTCIIQCCLMRH